MASIFLFLFMYIACCFGQTDWEINFHNNAGGCCGSCASSETPKPKEIVRIGQIPSANTAAVTRSRSNWQYLGSNYWFLQYLLAPEFELVPVWVAGCLDAVTGVPGLENTAGKALTDGVIDVCAPISGAPLNEMVVSFSAPFEAGANWLVFLVKTDADDLDAQLNNVRIGLADMIPTEVSGARDVIRSKFTATGSSIIEFNNSPTNQGLNDCINALGNTVDTCGTILYAPELSFQGFRDGIARRITSCATTGTVCIDQALVDTVKFSNIPVTEYFPSVLGGLNDSLLRRISSRIENSLKQGLGNTFCNDVVAQTQSFRDWAASVSLTVTQGLVDNQIASCLQNCRALGGCM